MRFSSIILAVAAAATTVAAVPYNSAHEELHHKFAERDDGPFVVTGASGDVQPRLEIRQMYFTKPNQYTLLILALQKWQAMPQSDKLSYYQISGIHGVPRVDWDSVSRCDTCTGDNVDGYCTHDSVLFPAWHRVYIALFEQQFLNVVNDIANSWTGDGTAAIQNAAKTMRWPYWDWAAHPKPGYKTFPAVMSQKYVSVQTPSGAQTIHNPLFRYSFQDTSELVYGPYVNNWKYTFRYPNTNEASANSQTSQVVQAFENIRQSLQDSVWQLFSTCKDYAHFSNDAAASSSTACSNSLEGIHNTVHMTTGGSGQGVASGHMSVLSLAAFDPVFWLHHTNIDRLFAMWQRVNPDAYGASEDAPHTTWTIAAGSPQNADSPLKPMHKNSNGDFYSTNDVKDWTQFKYTYPEFSDSDGTKASINKYVNQLYGPQATATAGSSKRDILGDVVNAAASAASGVASNVQSIESVAATAFAAPTAQTVSGGLPLPTSNPLSNLTSTIQNVTTAISQLINPIKANNGSHFQYVANIQTPRYALNGTYSIYLFNGNPTSETPSSWLHDDNLIGPVGVLAQPGMTGHPVLVAASIPLTRTLTYAVADGLLTDLSEELVEPYLKKNLKWRVLGPKGDEVSSDNLPGFNIDIFGSTAAISDDKSQLPDYSDFVQLQDAKPNCTANAAR